MIPIKSAREIDKMRHGLPHGKRCSRSGERADPARDFDQGNRSGGGGSDAGRRSAERVSWVSAGASCFPRQHLHFAERRDCARHRQPAPDPIRRHREARYRRGSGWLGGRYRGDHPSWHDRRADRETARGDAKRAATGHRLTLVPANGWATFARRSRTKRCATISAW